MAGSCPRWVLVPTDLPAANGGLSDAALLAVRRAITDRLIALRGLRGASARARHFLVQEVACLRAAEDRFGLATVVAVRRLGPAGRLPRFADEEFTRRSGLDYG